jgi:hypothetical protein
MIFTQLNSKPSIVNSKGLVMAGEAQILAEHRGRTTDDRGTEAAERTLNRAKQSQFPRDGMNAKFFLVKEL